MTWFEVDRKGLRQLVDGKDRSALVFELLQNAWDENSTQVAITLEKLPRRPLARLVVCDDSPEGFRDLSHAFTLFAPTYKRVDASKRGRYNLGEKLVLALCEEATIETTTGCIEFASNGLRHRRRRHTDAGSIFKGLVRMNQSQFDEVCKAMVLLIPPIPTTFNGEVLRERKPVVSFMASLPTVVANAEGMMTRTQRQTEVRVYEPLNGEDTCVYELGIPLVSTGDRWHVDICQRVPTNMDRDNVSPAYLTRIRALVLNHTHDLLVEDDACESWVTVAMGHKDVDPEAVGSAVTKRYGENVVVYDPSDHEANSRATGKGWNVIHGGAFNAEQWEKVKESGVAQPAGQVFPTPKPYGDGDPANEIDPHDWTPGMQAVARLTERLAERLMGVTLTIRCVDTLNYFTACYCKGASRELHFNVRRLGYHWFEDTTDSEGLASILGTLIHEFAHEYESDHLSDNYHKALSRLAAKLAVLAANDPSILG